MYLVQCTPKGLSSGDACERNARKKGTYVNYDTDTVIEAARAEAHIAVNQAMDRLKERLLAETAVAARSGEITYKQPTDDECRDQRVKNGANFSQDGIEVLFRLFDAGAGYNSAARKLGVTQSAIKRWKGKYAEANGPNRQKRFIPWLDTKTA
jgi:hypothetical protein